MATLEHVRNAVRHRILHQRLQQQWRNEAQTRVTDVNRHLQAVAETDAFDLQVLLDQRELTRQRNPFRGSKREALAKEVTQQDRHSSRSRWVSGRQGADRVQAVEQKVRIDLCAQRSKLRFLREHLGLQ